jgi:hypothetical protein
MFGAKNIQNWLIREQHNQHTDAIREQRNVAADIYYHFAQVGIYFSASFSLKQH